MKNNITINGFEISVIGHGKYIGKRIKKQMYIGLNGTWDKESHMLVHKGFTTYIVDIITHNVVDILDVSKLR